MIIHIIEGGATQPQKIQVGQALAGIRIVSYEATEEEQKHPRFEDWLQMIIMPRIVENPTN